MTNYHVLGIVAREQQHTILAQAQAARRAKHLRTRLAALPSRPLRLQRRSRRHSPHAGRAVTDSVT